MAFENIKKGRLHESLGIPQDEPIPESVLMEHKNSDDPHMRKMVNFALNARKFKHRKK